MFDEEWESVFEKIIRSLLKRNSFEGIPEALVSLLELFRESLVSIVGSRSHIDSNTKRCRAECCGHNSWELSIVIILKSSKIV